MTATDLDRTCDGCCADAKVVVTLPSGNELLFCGHHANENHDGLVQVCATFTFSDDSAWLRREPVPQPELLKVPFVTVPARRTS
jgi:hypothetical protein